jgi:type II secretion system protein G
MNKQKIKGFTLVELLVVIAIIGLLASIVLVSLNNARTKARDTKRLSDLRQVAIALELYYDNNNNSYPTTGNNCSQANYGALSGGVVVGTMATPLQSGGYITVVPLDPINDGTRYYAYSSPAPSTEYVLRSRIIEVATNPALNTDVDGDALGCTTANSASCNDPAYCVQP